MHIDGMATPQWTSHIIYLDVSDLLINNMSALQNLLAFSEKFPLKNNISLHRMA